VESSNTSSFWRRSAPALTLVLLAPIISELLYGGTRVSYLYALAPEIGIWGCGALLIRYVARRRGLGWFSILLLALALAIAEECVIQQTSIAPLVGLAKHAYGRVWGVNWVYFLWALGYESMWVVLAPVQLVELIFPGKRDEPWVSRRGLVRVAIYFVLASYVAWYSWTQMARTKVFHMPPYHPSLLAILLAMTAILLLCVIALRMPEPVGPKEKAKNGPPSPWLVGLAAVALGTPWCALVLLGYGAAPAIPFEIPIVAGIAWAGGSFILIKSWSSNPAWRDIHRAALIFGCVVACMLGGFVVFWIGGALRVDWIGKIVTNIVALALLVRLNREVVRREQISDYLPL
jgi:hypothetical protein